LRVTLLPKISPAGNFSEISKCEDWHSWSALRSASQSASLLLQAPAVAVLAAKTIPPAASPVVTCGGLTASIVVAVLLRFSAYFLMNTEHHAIALSVVANVV
jgi:hypothetical protein